MCVCCVLAIYSGLKYLYECVSLDVESMKHDLGVHEYKTLKHAVKALELELWLEDNDLKSVHSFLVNEGYSTQDDVCTMTFKEVQHVRIQDGGTIRSCYTIILISFPQFLKHLSCPVKRDKFVLAVKLLCKSQDVPHMKVEAFQQETGRGDWARITSVDKPWGLEGRHACMCSDTYLE